ncbi:hypothetical protein GSI_09524 [Ganoderma sinense ZZ0214-1]|uniref:Uncharacterized protein n=1 Tax=Ganoderma sinense ZZ0214-1 TaxID=1077348 RepID=A0A2G8S3L0_9APHY|nr:hypothetical protein GSI_09524 [Ganoderma sinense ZZ0214-1]
MHQPPVADALAYFDTGVWPTEESSSDSPCSSSDTASYSEHEGSLETSGEYIEDSVTEDVSGSSSLPTGQADGNWVENFKFASEDDLLAWVRSLPDMGDETTEGGSSPSTSNTLASSSTLPQPPPMPICAVDQEIPLHYIPPPAEYRYAVRGRRVRDTEDLRKNIVNSLRWQRYYATEPCTFLPTYERDLPPKRKLLGTPPRKTDNRGKLDPPASVYKYTLDSDDDATSLSTCQRGTHPGDHKNTSGYSASELFGPDADTVKVARCEPIRPRAPVDLCELTTLEHTLRLRTRTDEATKLGPSATATVKIRADPRAVEFWKASVNEFVEAAQSAKLDEDTARLEAELKAFFEEAADHDEDDDLEAVEIPDAESEVGAGADVSFESEYAPTTVSESSSEESDSEDGEGVFDYEQWVADCQW